MKLQKVSYCLKCFALLNSSASVSPTIHHPPPTTSETLYIKILYLHKSKMIRFFRLCWNPIFSVNCATKRYDNSGTHDRACDFYVCSGEEVVTCIKQKMYTSEYTQWLQFPWVIFVISCVFVVDKFSSLISKSSLYITGI